MSDEITLKGFWTDNAWPFENSYFEAWTNVIYNVIAKQIVTRKKNQNHFIILWKSWIPHSFIRKYGLIFTIFLEKKQTLHHYDSLLSKF